jgi:hypothetical protein
MRTRVLRTTLLPLPSLLLIACSGDGDEPPAAATTTVTTTVTAPAPSSPAAPTGRDDEDPDSEEPPADGSFPADTSDDGGPAEQGSQPDPAGQTRVAGLRTGQHEGYSRLVIDLSSSGVPAWSVGYSEPTGPGGGPVDIQGEAFLRVVVETAAEPGGQSQINITSSPGPIVQVRTTGFFEGQEEVLVGIRDGEQPFRAFALTDPGRIVIDVREG